MIDNKLLNAYISELEALRVHGRDFAQAYPDIAARLDIGPRRSRDAHVERVVESTAFLAARLRMMLENQSTELPMSLLSMLAPTLLEPVPSMTVVELSGGSEEQLVPRGTRFDHQFGGHALVCFTTTASLIAAPVTLQVRRLNPQANFADGIAIGLAGRPPSTLKFWLGNDEMSAAVLTDALAEDLGMIEVAAADGTTRRVPTGRLRLHGFAADEAALPVRPAAHQSHRIVTEFLSFPEKFRMASLTGARFEHGGEIRFFFTRRLELARGLPGELISVNRVPAINLWPTAGTPFDINGRQLEYPVRVDAQRYRIIECHSVEEVQMYGRDGDRPIRLDPMLALGDIAGTEIRWGTRRAVSRAGGEVMLYFQGLDYRMLGEHQLLAAPQVLASNGDLPARARVGETLYPLEGLGNWRAALASVPTAYRPALVQSDAMRTLLGYMQSTVHELADGDRRGNLKSYLRQFPGGDSAAWINAIGRVALRPVATMRNDFPQAGLGILVGFDAERSRTTSRALVKRVLAGLFDSQRSLNRVEEVVVVPN